MEIYGTKKPPAYDFSKISAPIALYYANNDGIIAVENEQTLISMVPNVANDYLVPYELFRHVDFIFAKDIIELVYNELMSVMEKY
ncbi:hypothetical protein BDFB_012824 [Asbolus verrucosus]|uniref:Abhydrolase 1 domain containing protein n=1 Tax=Asbolus verrucosus TaxID=1661398 RepID=A0A482V7F9_ASBVE|nr:hypothetical protein BDFB_012824 [Asbolus verrucosus]